MQSVGDDLISIPMTSPRAGQALAIQLRETNFWLEVVAGINSVVVQFDIACINRKLAEQTLREVMDTHHEGQKRSSKLIEIPVAYGGDDGPDLVAVCRQLAMSESDFIALHTSREYEVDMLGFTPGFAYIGGLDHRLNVPRLTSPRLSVPAGSVGIADGRTGLYALQGPGGWPIVGRSFFKLFDKGAEPPFLLGPGCKVRFVVGQES